MTEVTDKMFEASFDAFVDSGCSLRAAIEAALAIYKQDMGQITDEIVNAAYDANRQWARDHTGSTTVESMRAALEAAFAIYQG